MSTEVIKTANLLVELLVEELPPKALKKLGEAFAHWIRQGLIDRLLVSPEEKWDWYASPRRLAVRINNVEPQQRPRLVTEKLMPVSVAYDATGKPTQALLKKAKAKNFKEEDFAAFTRRMEGDIEVLVFQWTDPGFALEQMLGDVLEETFAKLPIPKMMTYQLDDGWSTVNFVRPAHALVALHGGEILEGVRTHSNNFILGLKPARITFGHRFEAKSPVISIRDADSYAQQLREEGAVIASFTERRAEIVRQLRAVADPLGLKPVEDDALLDEVTALVERPNVLVGKFEEAYLEVPPECLILTMKANQKYFPLLDIAGKLTNQFLIVSNISPADPSAVIQGNERVVRPRLADAKFFFDQDRKKTLASRLPGLDKVVYHNKLGTQGERVERVRAIAKWIAKKVDPELEILADRAAELAKADLLTDMVGEFPELQGIMGGYYARGDGEDERVAEAIADQYLLRLEEGSGEANFVSVILQIADRIETLLGIWGIGLKPTGDKDPFALRRHAISIIRSFNTLSTVSRLNNESMPIDLDELICYGLSVFTPGVLGNGVAEEVKLFIYERCFNQLAFLGAEAVASVFAIMPPLHEILKRVEAVREFSGLPEAQSLAAANKRVGNILKKVEGAVGESADPARFVEDAEKELFAALSEVAPQADAAYSAGDYTGSLQALAALKAPVDAFFDSVMVNADDPALRANRLALLNKLHQTMNRVADISRLAA